MVRVSPSDISLFILSLRRPDELTRTLTCLQDVANVNVILNGAKVAAYEQVVDAFSASVGFTVNRKNLGVAAGFNQAIVLSNTRYVVLSGDDLFYPQGWMEPLLSALNSPDPPSQVSLSTTVAFSSFCVDKRLIAEQGWFDHNFTRIHYEDDDWCLRVRERIGGGSEPRSAQDVIPRLNSVIRNQHVNVAWNSLPNRLYFWRKWERVDEDVPGVIYLRPWLKVRRRRREPKWTHLESFRTEYLSGDFSSKRFIYDRPELWIGAITSATTNRPLGLLLHYLRRTWNREGILK